MNLPEVKFDPNYATCLVRTFPSLCFSLFPLWS